MYTRTFKLTAAALVLAMATPLYAAESAVTSTEQGATPMDELDMQGAAEGISAGATEPSPFFRDAKVSAQARSYYLTREEYDDSNKEAWAVGGSVGIKSGYAGNFFALGAMAYTSQPLYAPDDHDGTLLLETGQDGYSVLGQIYGEFKLGESLFAAVGRKEYNTPFLNKNDVRMTPNTFEGASVYGTQAMHGGQLRYAGGFISKIKERNSNDFVWLSRDAGAAVDRGVYVGGANYLKGDMSIGAVGYSSDDLINIFYTEGKYGIPLDGGIKLKFAAQYIDQQSNGQDLLGDFSTNQWGVKSDLAVGAALFGIAYTDTSDNYKMQNPWSSYPGYTSVQVEDFNRAGESAVLLRTGYDLTQVGWEGVSVYALWVEGSGVEGGAFNQSEGDLNLQWTPKSGAWQGTTTRVRLAKIYQDGGGDPDKYDFRIIFTYDVM